MTLPAPNNATLYGVMWIPWLSSIAVCLTLLSSVPAAHAWQASPDVGLDLAGSVITRGDVIDDGDAVTPLPINLGPVPSNADVVAYTAVSGGDVFFVLGQTTSLPGGITAGPHQVVRWDGVDHQIELDLDLPGFDLADGVGIDALGLIDNGNTLALSFDTSTVFMGTFLDDADVLDGSDLSLAFDSRAAGIAAGADLDAVSEADDGWGLFVSFDIGGTVGGITYADEDVLRVVPPGYSWWMEVDASAVDSAWARADIDAVHFVPEPSLGLQLVVGALGLLALSRRRI